MMIPRLVAYCLLPTASVKRSRGFTLIELLVVITIIGILSGIGVAAFTSVQKKGRDAQRKSDLSSIQAALEQYYSDHDSYPGETYCDSSVGSCGAQLPIRPQCLRLGADS